MITIQFLQDSLSIWKDVVLIVDPFSTGSAYANEFRKRGYKPVCLILSKNLPEKKSRIFNFFVAFYKNTFILYGKI